MKLLELKNIIRKIVLAIVAITFPLWIIPVIAIVGIHAAIKDFYIWLNCDHI